MEQNMNLKTSKLAAASFALVAAAALPLGLAESAQAATTKDGCTVTPLPPEFRQTFDPQNRPYVFYPYEVSCVGSASGLDVEVKTVTWEADRVGVAGDVDANGVEQRRRGPDRLGHHQPQLQRRRRQQDRRRPRRAAAHRHGLRRGGLPRGEVPGDQRTGHRQLEHPRADPGDHDRLVREASSQASHGG